MPFEKGQSGNPGGRPKKENSFTGILEELGKRAPDGAKKARKQLLAERLWDMALEGDMSAIKYIYDRVDGRAKESIQHSGSDGDNLNMVVTFVDGR